MSVQPPETPTPTPAPAKTFDKLVTLFGLLLFVTGVIVARALRVPPGGVGDAELGADIGDTLKSFGVVIASIGGALPIPELLRRALGAGGAKLIAVLAAGGVLSASSLLGGCALLERRKVHCTDAPVTEQEDDTTHGLCITHGYCDGAELWTAIGPGPCGEVETVSAPAATP